MKELGIAKMLVEKRHERGLTQEDVASFVGVSKASVSKWETGQSYPDITLLPMLASYFRISVDELIGYEPQLEKSDIRAVYLRLSRDFAEKSFEQVMEQCTAMVKKYYSCMPFLVQMSALYLNHYTLTPDKKRQREVLGEAVNLCERVAHESDDVSLAKEATYLEAVAYLFKGEPGETLRILGNSMAPIQSEISLMASAYMQIGEPEKALESLQVASYQYLLLLMALMGQLLPLYRQQPGRAEEILRRLDGMTELFDLDALHPNTMENIYLMAAMYYAGREEKERALEYLDRYTKTAAFLQPLTLHGDAFFDRIEDWIDTFALGKQPPRNLQLVNESLFEGVAGNPAFENLREHPEFKRICNRLRKLKGE